MPFRTPPIKRIVEAMPPAVQKRFRRYLYNNFNTLTTGLDIHKRFLNLGLISPDKIPLLPEDEPDRLSIQLYHELLKDVPLDDRSVLEIGCGKGGGSYYLTAYRRPAAITGLDYSGENIRTCNKSKPKGDITFVQGDAENTRLKDASFDVLLNLESSHCYPSRDTRFSAEVVRLLKPGGYFAYGDVLLEANFATFTSALTARGLRKISETDITDRVVASLRSQAGRDAKLLPVNPFWWLPTRFYRNFIVAENSDMLTAMANHWMVYKLFVFQKN